jgi:TonB family protein
MYRAEHFSTRIHPLKITIAVVSLLLTWNGPVHAQNGLVSTDVASGDSIESVLQESNDDLTQMELQIKAGEFDLPQAWLNAHVDRVQRNSHRFDPQLVKPLTLLGDIEARRGNYDQALDLYGQAVHVQRVSSGLVSPGQVEIVHREADVYRSLGDMKNANEREEYAYHVLKAAYEAYDQNLLPGVFRLAQWYTSTNNIYAARALYQRSFDILTANGRGGSPEAIPALEGLAATYRQERFPPFFVVSTASSAPGASAGRAFDAPITIGDYPRGEQALQQIVQIRRDHGNDPLQVSEAVLDLADWYLLFDRPKRAMPLYDFAYDLLNGTENVDADSFFAQPRLLHFPAPSDPKAPELGTDGEPQIGHVELSFDVTPNGFVRDLKTIASQPEGMMDFRVRKSVRASRFRPAIVDGVAVKTDDQTFRHEFTYYPAPTPAEPISADAAAVQ